jgi:hypothetical protein
MRNRKRLRYHITIENFYDDIPVHPLSPHLITVDFKSHRGGLFAFNEESLEEPDRIAFEAENYLRWQMSTALEVFVDSLEKEALLWAEFQIQHQHLSIKERHKKFKALLAQLDKVAIEYKLSRLRIPSRLPAGRPKGTGWFLNVEDFKIALSQQIPKIKGNITELNLLKQLDTHTLCQRPPNTPRKQSNTSLLRQWIKKAGLKDFNAVVEKYSHPLRKRK